MPSFDEIGPLVQEKKIFEGFYHTLKSFKNAKKKIGNFLHQGYFKSSVTGERDQ